MVTVKGVWKFNDTISMTGWAASANGTEESVDFTAYQNAVKPVGSFTGFRLEHTSFASGKYVVDALRFIRTDGSNQPYIWQHYYPSASIGWSVQAFRFVDFGRVGQGVSNSFYAWLTANASEQRGKTGFINITNGGAAIATLSNGQSATLACGGKKIVKNIVVGGMPLEIKYNGDGIATLKKGQTATIPCDGMKMLTDLTVNVLAENGGLYDSNDVCLASGETLFVTYDMCIEKNYSTYGEYETNVRSPYYILTNYEELATGTKMIIPDSVTRIGEGAFRRCSGLTSIIIPDSVETIDWGAFVSCTGLTTIVIPDSVTGALSGAFQNCTGLRSIRISKNIDMLGSSNFAGCTSLEHVTVPGNVILVGQLSFQDCTGLISVTLEAGVQTIGGNAFEGCSKLSSITIPNSVTDISYGAFEDCVSLEHVYYQGTQEQWNLIAVGTSNEPLTNATIHCIGDSNAISLISFTIDGVTYQAEEGTTWEQWCGSEYNTGGYDADSSGRVLSADVYAVTTIENTFNTGMVSTADTIVAGYAYYHTTGQMGGAD